MGRIRSALGLADRQKAVQGQIQAGIYTGGATGLDKMPFATPWSTSQLERWVFQDMFGDLPQNNRANAIAIPAMVRARNIVVTSGSKLPLRELDEAGPVADQPYWITHTGDGSTPLNRMAWTIDDLIFYGVSLWGRNDVGTDRETRHRFNQDEWEINSDRREILVNGDAVRPDEVILFVGLHEGVLTYGRETILDTKLLYRNVRQRIKNPVPQIDLHQTGGEPLTKTAKDELLADWRAARDDESKGGVAYTSQWIEAKPIGDGGDASLMIQARNASAVDCARLIGITAGKVDATAPKASLDYTTQDGRNEEFVDFDLDLYVQPIQARLSEDDVCEVGRRVRFDEDDFTTLTPSPTGPVVED